jgi:hypothetical protein
MNAQFRTEFGAGEASITERGEEAELDGGEEDLGTPEAKAGLENGIGCEGLRSHAAHFDESRSFGNSD